MKETFSLCVDAQVKQDAEAVLDKLGIPLHTAIDMYLSQISLMGGIPFSVTLPKTREEQPKRGKAADSALKQFIEEHRE